VTVDLCRLTLAIVLVLLLVGCSAQPKDSLTTHPPASAETPASDPSRTLDVAEAVFRFQFGHNASGTQQNASAYYVSLLGGDPSPEFLDRFAGNEPPVKAQSGFREGGGLKFIVREITFASETEAEVTGGYYEGNLSSSQNTYYVEYRGGEWVVVRDVMNAIS
jgi:hypothetical protein